MANDAGDFPDDNTSNLVNEAYKKGAVPDGYRELDIAFFQFKKPGDSISGKLTDKSIVTLKSGNEVGKYSIHNPEDGKRYSFLGSVQLDDLMKSVTKGQSILVVYTNDEILENQFTMKRFKLFVKTA